METPAGAGFGLAKDSLSLGDEPVDVAEAQKLPQKPQMGRHYASSSSSAWMLLEVPESSPESLCTCHRSAQGEPETKERGGHRCLATLRLVPER